MLPTRKSSFAYPRPPPPPLPRLPLPPDTSSLSCPCKQGRLPCTRGLRRISWSTTSSAQSLQRRGRRIRGKTTIHHGHEDIPEARIRQVQDLEKLQVRSLRRIRGAEWGTMTCYRCSKLRREPPWNQCLKPVEAPNLSLPVGINEIRA